MNINFYSLKIFHFSRALNLTPFSHKTVSLTLYYFYINYLRCPDRSMEM